MDNIPLIMNETRRFLSPLFSCFQSRKADQETEQEIPQDIRSTAAYWRERHHEEPIQSKEILTTRLLVSAERVELVTAAGGRVLYPSVRALFDTNDDADECGYPEHLDVAVVEVTTDSNRFAGLDILAGSYRWENERPRQCDDREVIIPTNSCDWFAKVVCSRPVLLWLDYIASDFGRVVNEVLPKMGLIYSRFPVFPYYLLDPTLTLESMSRGWIFQETAFTCLDPEAMNAYKSGMEEAVAWMFHGADLPVWARNNECVALALEGFFAFYERRCNSWLEPNVIANSTIIKLVREGVWHEHQSRIIADDFARSNDKTKITDFLSALCSRYLRQSQNLNLDSLHQDNKAGLVLAAFAQLDFSYEEDCIVGSLAQFAKAFFGETLSQRDVHAAQGLLKFLWEVRMDSNMCHVIAGVKRTMPGTATVGLGPLHLPRVSTSKKIDKMMVLGIEESKTERNGRVHQIVSIACTNIATHEAKFPIPHGTNRSAFEGFSTILIPGDKETKRFGCYLGTTAHHDSIRLVITVFGDGETGRVLHLCVRCQRSEEATGYVAECTVPRRRTFKFH